MKPPIPTDLGWRDFHHGPWGPTGETGRRLALLLFLASLTMLFAASLISYALVRNTGEVPTTRVVLPRGLWASTAVLLVCGVVIALMHRAARARSISRLRVWLPAAWLLSIAFLAVQTPSVVQLARAHDPSLKKSEGLVYVLIVLHALHVIGGLVPLTRLLLDQVRGRLTENRLGSVRSVAVYWHFLEAVWVTMFTTFLVVG